MELTTQRKRPFPKDRDATARRIVFAIGALSIVLLFALWRASSFRNANARVLTGTDQATGASPGSVDESAQGPSTEDQGARSSATDPALSPVAATAPDSAAIPEAEREHLRKNLTSAIEASLSGALDPEAIVQSALALLRLHVEKGILPTTAPDGSLRYPLSECPAGVQAELWVARSTGSKFEDVLSLRVQLAAPVEPYLLEGAVRKDPIAYVQAFLDESGRMKDLVIMTDIAPSGESRKFGLSVLQGRVPQGIIFHVDTSRPDEWKASSYGLDDGADRSWDDPVALLGDPWPGPDALGELGSGLLGLLSEARR
jgi:hypothetical protein